MAEAVARMSESRMVSQVSQVSQVIARRWCKMQRRSVGVGQEVGGDVPVVPDGHGLEIPTRTLHSGGQEIPLCCGFCYAASNTERASRMRLGAPGSGG